MCAPTFVREKFFQQNTRVCECARVVRSEHRENGMERRQQSWQRFVVVMELTKKRKKEREEEVKSCDEQDNLMPKRAHNVCTRRKLFQQWLNELQTI